MTRTGEDVREYLLPLLNSAIGCPSAFGDELGISQLLSHLAFIDGCEVEWDAEREALSPRQAFESTGVTGAVLLETGCNDEAVMASVYAEIAHRHGWLRMDRVLSRGEYERVRGSVVPFCARDRR